MRLENGYILTRISHEMGSLNIIIRHHFCYITSVTSFPRLNVESNLKTNNFQQIYFYFAHRAERMKRSEMSEVI